MVFPAVVLLVLLPATVPLLVVVVVVVAEVWVVGGGAQGLGSGSRFSVREGLVHFVLLVKKHAIFISVII